jgi:hypothetical protein
LPTTLQFRAPAGSSASDIKAASKLMQARCEQLGYKGVTVSCPESNLISLECKTGITPKMMGSLKTVGLLAAQVVEIRFWPALNERQKEQHLPGGTAPDGAEWLKDQEPEWTKHGFTKRDGKSPGWWLVQKSPKFDVRIKWKSTSSGWARELASGMRWVKQASEKEFKQSDRSDFPNELYFEFDRDTSKALFALPRGTIARCALFVDGAWLTADDGILFDPERSDGKARWTHAWSTNDILGVCLNNPLPFPLTILKEY